MLRAFGLAIVSVVLAAGAVSAQANKPISVLVVGNSYVYRNDLPVMLREMAKEGGHAVEIEAITGGGLTLRDHVSQGKVTEKLRTRKWDYVILQGQSQECLTNPDGMRLAARELGTAIAKNGAKPILFVTWARKAHPETQPAIDKAYAAIAADLKAEISPVGATWMKAQADPSTPRLYDGDGSHPSRLGTYLTTCVLYSTLFDRTPVGLPVSIFGVEQREIEACQSAAWSQVKPIKDAQREAQRREAGAIIDAAIATPPTSTSKKRGPLVIDNTKPQTPPEGEKPVEGPK